MFERPKFQFAVFCDNRCIVNGKSPKHRYLVFENSFQSTEQNGNRETQLYEEKLAELEKDINSKNQRIKRLEEILSSKRGRQTMRQVSRERENLSNMMSLPWLAVSECEAGERSQQPGSVPLCRVRGGEAV